MKGFVAVLIPLILLLGCHKDIQNKEAVRQGVLDYFKKRPDLMAMDVSVSAVQFRQDEADAMVYVKAKGEDAPGSGMQMRYTLERKENRWVVKGRAAAAAGANANPHGGPGAMQMPMPGAGSGANLPPGHPHLPSQADGNPK